jgi:hypothetical protein
MDRLAQNLNFFSAAVASMEPASRCSHLGAEGDRKSLSQVVAPTADALSSSTPVISAVLSVDFMAVTPLNQPPQPPPAWLLQSSLVNLSQGVIFWTNAALRSAR